MILMMNNGTIIVDFLFSLKRNIIVNSFLIYPIEMIPSQYLNSFKNKPILEIFSDLFFTQKVKFRGMELRKHWSKS